MTKHYGLTTVPIPHFLCVTQGKVNGEVVFSLLLVLTALYYCQLAINYINLSYVQSVLPVTVIGKRSPCPYLKPQAFFHSIFSLCPSEEGEWDCLVVFSYLLVLHYRWLFPSNWKDIISESIADYFRKHSKAFIYLFFTELHLLNAVQSWKVNRFPNYFPEGSVQHHLGEIHI